jgi:RNA polymerase-associated protein RTF1
MTPSSQTPNGTPKKEGLSQQERLAQINAENRRKNAEAVRQAQIKERAKIRDKVQRNDSVEPGRSPRVGASPGKSPMEKPKDGVLPHMEKLRLLQQQNVHKTGVAVIHKPLMDDDIIGALDLDIDVEI